MSEDQKPTTEVKPKANRRRFSVEYKRRIVAEAAQCEHGELGALLRREGLYYSQIADWRRAEANGTLVQKKRGPKANPDATRMKQLKTENERLKKKLEQAEAIIEAQKKLAALMDQLKKQETS